MRLLPMLVVAAICAAPARADDAAAITAAADHYAALLKDGSPAEIAAAYARDGELILPGTAPIHGRAAIADFLAPLMKTATVLSVEMHVETAVPTGTGTETQGSFRQSASVGGAAPQEFKGRFSGLWAKRHGRWLIVRLTMKPE